MATALPIVAASGLTKHFPAGGGLPFVRSSAWVRAVDNVSLEIGQGQSVGLVGESGCGKSTLGRLLLRLIEPTSGTVTFEGTELTSLPPEPLRRLRSGMQMVFQDPYASLDPRKRVLDIVEEGMLAHGQRDHVLNRVRIVGLLTRVGLDERALYRYPHHFSGGQRQRIGIARALAVGARFIVADEPVSALDVSIQAQVLNLLADLRDDLQLTILLVSHDLAVVHHFTERVLVMYLGKIVEDAPSEVLYLEPRHPYTRALLECIPAIDPARRGRMRPLAGEIPTPLNPPSGCRFHPRCPLAQPICSEVEPALEPKAAGHLVACHFA
ncbi:MAG TPA: ABC transporter ATP-binding protein [Chloroflexota bacterium]|jgi:oligopeptide/dipeptide ABC transporter ATP-binding protein